MTDPRPTATTDDRYTWDLTTIFVDAASWRDECEAVRIEAHRLARFRGDFTTSGERLYHALRDLDVLGERLGRVGVYASLLVRQDSSDDEANKMAQQVDLLESEVSSLLSFVEPEILSRGWEHISGLVREYPALSIYRHYLSEIERGRPHVLSCEQEALLSSLSPLSGIPESIRQSVHDGDMTFPTISVGTSRVDLSHGTIEELLQSPDRDVRCAAYKNYTDGYISRSKTFAATLTAQVTTSLLFNRAHNFSTTFEEALFSDALSPRVYHAAMRSCREHQPLFHRYFRAKAKILGVSRLAEHDIFAKLSPRAPEIHYESAVSVVLEALAPLGEEYVSIARQGLTKDRWAHVYPRPGKYSNAFSSGVYGTRPFLLLNYAPTMPEVGTLAHELGHSMHSFLTHRTQPSRYASYPMTVAETASNLNQVLLRAHILRNADRDTALAVLDEAFYFAHRYLFMMPTLSRVEHVIHSIYSRGGALGASDICRATVTAFSAAYGDSVSYEPERLGTKWAKFCHFYAPYYFFQYAVGISAAMAIGGRILAGEPGMRDRYLSFLSAGGSLPTLETFKLVGIDIESEDVYRDAFRVVEDYVERLERL